MNNAIENYNYKGTKDNLLKEYNSFIDKFDLFKKNKKGKHNLGSNQNKLLNYGNEFKKIMKKMFINNILIALVLVLSLVLVLVLILVLTLVLFFHEKV